MSLRFNRLFFGLVFLLCMTLLISANEMKGAEDSPALAAAHGVVDKADKDSVMIKPRGPDGKYQKAISLKVTGTSRVTMLVPQKRGEAVTLTQRDIGAKDLSAGQAIAVIYTEAGSEGPVLLSAVAESGKK
jgi:hypothetical protein